MKKTLYTIYGWVMLLVCILLNCENISQKRELKEYEELQNLWQEKMDTCMNRNERLYNELESLREYKIMKKLEERDNEPKK